MSTFQYSFAQVLPDDVSVESVIELLHHHDNIIMLSPYVLKHSSLPSIRPTSQSYEIVDKIDYLPFGLYSGLVTVTANFTNNDDGVSTMRDAPLGFVIHEDWVVRPRECTAENDHRKNELVLKIKMVANYVVLNIFANMMKKNHEEIYMAGMMNLISRNAHD